MTTKLIVALLGLSSPVHRPSCVLHVRSVPVSAMVERMHLGEMQVYVAEVPDGWPLPFNVARWPRLIPGSCDDIGTCAWIDVRDDDCERMMALPQCQGALSVGGW